MPKDILERTGAGAKFCLKNFKYMVNKYIEDNWNKTDSTGKKKTFTILNFCCINGFDSEDDFWRLVTEQENDDYRTYGRKLAMYVRETAQRIAIDDKNIPAASLMLANLDDRIKELDLKGGKIFKSVPKNIKEDKKDVDIKEICANLSSREWGELIKGLSFNQ